MKQLNDRLAGGLAAVLLMALTGGASGQIISGNEPNPDYLTDAMVLWLDADDATTVTPAVGGTVTAWTDKSTYGKDVGTVAGTPTYAAPAGPGTGKIAFDGSADEITVPGTPLPNGSLTVFFAVNPTSTDTSSFYVRGGLVQYDLADLGSVNGVRLDKAGGSSWGAYFRDASVADEQIYLLDPYAPGDQLWAMIIDYNASPGTTTLTLYKDGVLVGSESSPNIGPTVIDSSSDDLYIMWWPLAGDSSRHLAGEVYEILAYKKVLDAAEHGAVGWYLQQKWGIGSGYGTVVNVYGGSPLTLIVNEDDTPSLAEGTEFGEFELGGTAPTNTFRITNDRGGDLTVTGITTPGDFSLTGAPTFPQVISNGAYLEFTLTYEPLAIGDDTETITIVTTEEGNHTFDVHGWGYTTGDLMVSGEPNPYYEAGGGAAMVLWLDADDATTVSPSAGGTVTAWTDKSNNGKNVGTVGSTPTYVAPTGPGTGKIAFNGSDEMTVPGTPLPNESLTVFFAVNPTSPGPGTTQLRGGLSQFDTAGGDFNGFRLEKAGPDNWFGVFRDTEASFHQVVLTDPYATGNQLWAAIIDYNATPGTTTLTLYKNGLPVGSDSSTDIGATVIDSSSDDLYIMWWPYSTDRHLAGDVYEILAYRTDLNSGQHNAVGRYLQEKWGIGSGYGLTVKVQGGSPLTLIPNGDDTPSEAEGTEFGEFELGGSAPTSTFRINNDRGDDLTVTGITTPGDFSLTGSPGFPRVISNGAFWEFTLKYEPLAIGDDTETITIVTTEEGNHTFDVHGLGYTAGNLMAGDEPNPYYETGGVTAMRLWLDADAPATISSDANGITLWENRSTYGSGLDALPSGGATRQPSYHQDVDVEGTTRGRVYFDGDSSQQDRADVANYALQHGPNTVFFVLDAEGDPDASTNVRGGLFQRYNSPNYNGFALGANGAQWSTAFVDTDGDYVSLLNEDTPGNQLWAVIIDYNVNPGTTTLSWYIDGVPVGSNAATDIDTVIDANASSLAIMYRSTSAHLAGSVYEILVYNAALTPDDHNAVGYYLQTKWGIGSGYTSPRANGTVFLFR